MRMIKTDSLKKNYEFMRAYKKGKFHAGRFIILYALANKSGRNRIGITSGKKVGGSVQRNRVKRLIRENYRFYETFVKDGFDLVFVARGSERLPEFMEIKKEMKFLLKKLNVFDRETWEFSKQY
jgi:ribonuclease P protein component